MNYEKIVRNLRHKMFDYPPELEDKAKNVLKLAKAKMIAQYPDFPKAVESFTKVQKPFKPVPGPFGIGKDEQATKDALIEYLGGRDRIEKLSRIFKNAYPTPKFRGGTFTKNEVFRGRALKEGFTDMDVDGFLSL